MVMNGTFFITQMKFKNYKIKNISFVESSTFRHIINKQIAADFGLSYLNSRTLSYMFNRKFIISPNGKKIYLLRNGYDEKYLTSYIQYDINDIKVSGDLYLIKLHRYMPTHVLSVKSQLSYSII
jgi:transcriptional/translational regulatory protein YebC/TACO1